MCDLMVYYFWKFEFNSVELLIFMVNKLLLYSKSLWNKNIL